MKLADHARIGWHRAETPRIDHEVSLVQRAGVRSRTPAQGFVGFVLAAPAAG
ncbi:hypothetical protein [Variovorax sp. efr-133-TYG-130]|uniref:hypothetical protein n=1 Tax=Variovorax sp. efr-133-TYG-130 TaxID=3040327 RepID=UPI002554CE48|nr:hypothetical protein [Variovorax sp. efr-133-TYG-130]